MEYSFDNIDGDILQEDGSKILQEDGGSIKIDPYTVHSLVLSDELGVLDRHTWNEMVFTWDDYTNTWDSYGELEVQHVLTAVRTFTDSITNAEIFATIATIHRTLTDSIEHTESFLKAPIKILSDSISKNETFGRIATTIRNLSDSITHTDSLMNMVSKNLLEALSMTDSLVKNVVRHLSETIGLIEYFSIIPNFIRTFTDNMSVSEADWTWDMMSETWDDYTENWDYYRKAFFIMKILHRTVTDSILITEIINVLKFLSKPLSYIKDIAILGGSKVLNIISRVSGKSSISSAKNIRIQSRIISENITGKFK